MRPIRRWAIPDVARPYISAATLLLKEPVMRPIPGSAKRASSGPVRAILVVIAMASLLGWTLADPASATPGRVREFVLTPQSAPSGITVASDGTIWFTEWGKSVIGHLVPGVGLTEFAVPTPNSGLAGITLGPDDAFWFAEQYADQIGRITTDGQVTEFAVPPCCGQPIGPDQIATGPDGALWFTEFNASAIGRVTTEGQFTQWSLGRLTIYPRGITAGPDGAMWFTDELGIGRITMDGTISHFGLSDPYGIDIVTGPDGNLWFAVSYTDQVGRITPTGRQRIWDVDSQCYPQTIAAGPDGALWFGCGIADEIGRITTGGSITYYPIPSHPGGDFVESQPDRAHLRPVAYRWWPRATPR
jgi:virginiamycin B lyase